MYVLHPNGMTVITIFRIFPSLRPHLLLPGYKSHVEFIDEVDQSIDDVKIDYRYEAARLESFKNWPVSYVKPESLAAAGFYFTGQGDIVKCFDCHTELCQWLEGDDPLMDHERLSPTCRFVANVPCGNISIRRDYERSMDWDQEQDQNQDQTQDQDQERNRDRDTSNDQTSASEDKDNEDKDKQPQEEQTIRHDYPRVPSTSSSPGQDVCGIYEVASSVAASTSSSNVDTPKRSPEQPAGSARASSSSISHPTGTKKKVPQAIKLPCNNDDDDDDDDEYYGPSTSKCLEVRRVYHPLSEAYGTFRGNIEHARFPQYASYDERLKTFENWDMTMRQTKELLAEAGFFHEGHKFRDQTACFYCGVSLSNWKPDEEPWQMHSIWQPDCYYLIKIKGPAFASKIIDNNKKFMLACQSGTFFSSPPTRRSRKQLAGSSKTVGSSRTPGPSRMRSSQNMQRNVESITQQVAATSISDRPKPNPIPEPRLLPPRYSRRIRAETSLMCKICKRRKREMLFLPCNHIITCARCAKKALTCPVCMEYISDMCLQKYINPQNT